MCPAAMDFFVGQADFSQESWADFKENRGGTAEKAPPFGHVDSFQTRPKLIMLCHDTTAHYAIFVSGLQEEILKYGSKKRMISGQFYFISNTCLPNGIFCDILFL